jgi:hypothetical protein
MVNARRSMLWQAGKTILAGAALGCAISGGAQPSDAQRLRAALDDAARAIAPQFDCALSIRGAPIFQELSGTWVAFFMAEGPECDAAVQALSARAKALEVLLARRPTAEQVSQQVRATLSTVRGGFDCRIMLRGDPIFQDASGDWLVTYLGSGSDCDAVSEQLADLGKELQIIFVRNMVRQDLIR